MKLLIRLIAFFAGVPLVSVRRRECRSHRPQGETRSVTSTVELRDVSDKERADGFIGVLVGEIPLNSDSEVLTMRGRSRPFVERIARGAFSRSLKEDKDIMGFAGHTDDPLNAFARIGENLSFTESENSIQWRALLPDTQAGRDLKTLAQRKIIRGTSFEFEVIGDAGHKFEKRDDRTDLRTIVEARMLAVNPVAWPAYPESELTVSVRQRARSMAGDERAEERGNFLNCGGDACLDWWDPSVTPDTKFADWALNRATAALTNCLEYLRAVEVLKTAKPDVTAGALADFARAEAAAAANNAKTLIDWLVANGTAVNPAVLERARTKLAEHRSAEKPAPISQTDHDRERRFRILSLGSR